MCNRGPSSYLSMGVHTNWPSMNHAYSAISPLPPMGDQPKRVLMYAVKKSFLLPTSICIQWSSSNLIRVSYLKTVFNSVRNFDCTGNGATDKKNPMHQLLLLRWWNGTGDSTVNFHLVATAAAKVQLWQCDSCSHNTVDVELQMVQYTAANVRTATYTGGNRGARGNGGWRQQLRNLIVAITTYVNGSNGG